MLRRFITPAWLALLTASIAVSPAQALDPALNIAQYKHTRWTIDDGAPSSINDMAQGNDGYLWIVSADGLLRFDGVSFESIGPPTASEPYPPSAIVAARDGSIWVAFGNHGIQRYRSGRFTDTGLPDIPAPVVFLAQTRDGAIWAAFGRPHDGLARYSNGHWTVLGAREGLPDSYVMAMLPTRDGGLWVAMPDRLVVLRPGAHNFVSTGDAIDGRPALAEDKAGRVWLSDKAGTRLVGPAAASPSIVYRTPPAERVPQTLFDRDGNLWGISTTHGIYRLARPNVGGSVSGSAVTSFGAAQGLSSDLTGAILEDREGNIWVGSSLGLDRFRTPALVAEPALAVPSNGGAALGYDRRGTVYVGDDVGLAIVQRTGPPRRLRPGNVFAFCQNTDGSIWSAIDTDFVHLIDGRSDRFALPTLKSGLIFDCAIDARGTIWLAAGRDGIFRRDRGAVAWQPLSLPSTLEAPLIDNVEIDTTGRPMFNVYAGPLLVMDGSGALHPVETRPKAAPRVYAMYRSSIGMLLGTSAGLGRWRDGRIDWISASDVPMLASIHGMYEAADGGTLLFGQAGIVRTRTADLARAFTAPKPSLHARLFDLRDGLPNLVPQSIRHAIVPGAAGRLWFATRAGVVWLDPARLPVNRLMPPVTIRQVIARSIHYRDPAALTLPAGTADLEIDYSAPSLTIPERVQFRYQLEGVDSGWVNPGSRRQAFYTNLSPGHYRFRVIAANNDGVWNRTGAILDIDIPPTFFQSIWFTLLCLIVIGAGLWALYSLRLRQLAGRMHARLEARLAERERIARELHDTLLQGFQGLMLRFQAVAERIPADQPVRPLLDQALDRADAVLAEGRDRVKALRATSHMSLADRIADVADEFATDLHARFQLVVEGEPRSLHPVVLEEAAAIAGEALRNAFQHAQASAIDATLVFGNRALKLSVRDNGIGLPSEVVQTGSRAGHFGLTGMRERAARISATFDLLSRPGAGTEIILTIPGRVAYRVSEARRGRWWKSEPWPA